MNMKTALELQQLWEEKQDRIQYLIDMEIENPTEENRETAKRNTRINETTLRINRLTSCFSFSYLCVIMAKN